MNIHKIQWWCAGTGFALIILCAVAPILWWQYTVWQYCWFPPSDPNIEIIVSACQNPILYSISPDGRYMVYSANRSGLRETYSRNLVTGEERFPYTTGGAWLEDGLLLPRGFPDEGAGIEIWDVRDNTRTRLQWVQGIEGTMSRREDGTPVFSSQVVEWFRNAAKVYCVQDMAVALGPEFKTYPEHNYVLAVPPTSYGMDRIAIELFLKDNQIACTKIAPFEDHHVSRNGRFVVKVSDRYQVSFFTIEDTSIVNVDFPRTGDMGRFTWAYDNSGFYSQMREGGAIFVLPLIPNPISPIMKAWLPKEYLSPEARQARESWEAREQIAKTQSAIVFWFGVAVLVLLPLGILGWRGWVRRWWR